MIVEIDVLLPADCSLPRSHDICELIQNSIENLEGVARAYVHADYKCVRQFHIRLPCTDSTVISAQNPSGHQIR